MKTVFLLILLDFIGFRYYCFSPTTHRLITLKIVTVTYAAMSEHLHSYTQPNADSRSNLRSAGRENLRISIIWFTLQNILLLFTLFICSLHVAGNAPCFQSVCSSSYLHWCNSSQSSYNKIMVFCIYRKNTNLSYSVKLSVLHVSVMQPSSG
jgi:hypothetical protein